MNLFEHNRIAYSSVAAMLAETGKAAVIHPTGTGKSFIGFKLCEDHPEQTVCWLSPSDYIFRTQLENLYEASPDAKLLGLSANAIRYLDNQRNMADELFDGNIASEMTLGEAIVRGILNPPKYVLSMGNGFSLC